MVFRIGWISMGGQLSCEFGEKPASITQSGAWRQTRRAVENGVGPGDVKRLHGLIASKPGATTAGTRLPAMRPCQAIPT